MSSLLHWYRLTEGLLRCTDRLAFFCLFGHTYRTLGRLTSDLSFFLVETSGSCLRYLYHMTLNSDRTVSYMTDRSALLFSVFKRNVIKHVILHRLDQRFSFRNTSRLEIELVECFMFDGSYLRNTRMHEVATWM